MVENNPTRLSQLIVREAITELQDSGISQNNLDVLNHEFGFLINEMALQQKEDELLNIIKDVDSEVNSFRKNHQYIDVLSGLYIQRIS